MSKHLSEEEKAAFEEKKKAEAKSEIEKVELELAQGYIAELTEEEIQSQITRLDGLINRIDGKIRAYKRQLEVSRSLKPKTQKLIDVGKSYYDLDSNYEIKV